MPDWNVDPQECVARLSPWRDPCRLLVDRNTAMAHPSRLAYTENEHGADLYAHGHISTIRKGDKVRLTVNTSKTQAYTTPALSPQEALIAADCLRAASVNADASACAGPSIVELLWEALDALMDLLMDEDPQPDPDLLKGKAEGVAYSLAVFQNPYSPNLDSVRAQAMERWEERGNG